MAAFLITTLALIGAAAPQPATAPGECNRPAPIPVDAAATGPQRLDRLPAASHYLALHRTIDGCLKPIIVRADITGTKSDR